jgi:hypothetical protein
MRTKIIIGRTHADERVRRKGAERCSAAICQVANSALRRRRVADFLKLAGTLPHLQDAARHADNTSLADAKRTHR